MSRPIPVLPCSHHRQGRVRARPDHPDVDALIAERDNLVRERDALLDSLRAADATIATLREALHRPVRELSPIG